MKTNKDCLLLQIAENAIKIYLLQQQKKCQINDAKIMILLLENERLIKKSIQ